jgi:hypothetical protein
MKVFSSEKPHALSAVVQPTALDITKIQATSVSADPNISLPDVTMRLRQSIDGQDCEHVPDNVRKKHDRIAWQGQSVPVSARQATLC